MSKEMEVGKMYRILFTDENGDEQEFSGSYLGLTGTDHSFDLDPVAGTISVPADSIKRSSSVRDDKAKKPKAKS